MITIVCGSDRIDLPNPEFSDTRENLVPDVKIKFDMNFNIHTTIQSVFPYRAFSFPSLTATETLALQSFLFANAGKQVTLIDYDGVSKTGTIALPDGFKVDYGFVPTDLSAVAFNFLEAS